MANVPATDISTIRDAAVRRKLARLCGDYRALTAEASAIDATKKALMAEIKPIAKKLRLDKLTGDGWQLIKTKGKPSLKKELLLENGVSMDIIESSTVVGEPSYSVRELKDDSEGGDE